MFLQRRRSLLIFATLLQACHRSDRVGEHLSLVEEATWSARQIGPISGAAFAGDSIVIWSRSGGEIGVVDTHGGSMRVIELGPPSGEFGENEGVPIFAARSDSGLETIDGSTGRLLRLGSDGSVSAIDTILQRGGRVEAAFHSKAGWIYIVASEDSISRHSARYVAAENQPLALSTLHLPDNGPVWLSATPSGEITTLSLEAPFDLRILSQVESPFHKRFTNSTFDFLTQDGGERWVTTIPVWLDESHVLLTFSDLNSDRRMIVRLNRITGAQNVHQLNVPMAFLAADPPTQRLIALRATDGGQLILYRWRWVDAAQSIQPIKGIKVFPLVSSRPGTEFILEHVEESCVRRSLFSLPPSSSLSERSSCLRRVSPRVTRAQRLHECHAVWDVPVSKKAKTVTSISRTSVTSPTVARLLRSATSLETAPSRRMPACPRARATRIAWYGGGVTVPSS